MPRPQQSMEPPNASQLSEQDNLQTEHMAPTLMAQQNPAYEQQALQKWNTLTLEMQKQMTDAGDDPREQFYRTMARHFYLTEVKSHTNPDTQQNQSLPAQTSPRPQRVSTVPSIQRPNIDDQTAFSALAKYDTIFILDNTASMQQSADSKDRSPLPKSRWNLLEESIKLVVGHAIKYDKDGVDLYFLKAFDKLDREHVTSSAKVENVLQNASSLLDKPECGGGTDYLEALERAIEPRMSNFREYVLKRTQNLNPTRPRPLNLIAITDGGANDRDDVEEYLRNIAMELDDLKALRSYIGIQFVQVGDDKGAAEWLQKLDDNLAKDPNSRMRDVGRPFV